jgi:hypothetical protein
MVAVVKWSWASAHAQRCWLCSSLAVARTNHQLQWDVAVNDLMSAPRLLIPAHFV